MNAAQWLCDRRRTGTGQVAAHELRHDVHVSRQLLDDLRSVMQNDVADGRRFLSRQLGRALERLEHDIEELLENQGGDVNTVHRRPTNVGHLAMQVVQAHPTGRQPIDVDAAKVVANIDPVKVERILDNLLANALVHTPDDCPVRVRVAVEPPGITLTVEDEGPGLSDDAERALRNAGDEPPPGAMGLWIVLRFARLHGGDVRIERPASGRGARFTVWLPAQGSGQG